MAWLPISSLQGHRAVSARSWSGIEFRSIDFENIIFDRFCKDENETSKPTNRRSISSTLIRQLSQPSFQFASPCKRKSFPDEVTHSRSPKAVHILRPAFSRFRSFSPTPRSIVEWNVCEYITFFSESTQGRLSRWMFVVASTSIGIAQHRAWCAHICRIARPHRAPHSDSKVKISLDFYGFSSLSVRV